MKDRVDFSGVSTANSHIIRSHKFYITIYLNKLSIFALNYSLDELKIRTSLQIYTKLRRVQWAQGFFLRQEYKHQIMCCLCMMPCFSFNHLHDSCQIYDAYYLKSVLI